MTGWKYNLRSEFVPEWCALAGLVLLAAAWADHIHFHLAMTRTDFFGLAVILGVMLVLRCALVRRGGLMAEFFSLSLVAGGLVCILSYLCLASAGPLIDARLLAMDRALGFDWMAGYRFVGRHPLLAHLLHLAYGSITLQALYFCLLMGIMNRKERLREMFWLVLLMGLFACMGAALAPALGPFHVFGIVTPGSFLPQMQQLVDGRNLNFTLAHLTGVVSFPSFHTASALGYAWAFRKTGVIGWAMAGLNAVMLASVPWFGGHYLVDMLAGAAAMLLALAVVNGFVKLRASAANASPESAAVSAGAYSAGVRSR
jgi:membrane-associated phospholipid phosphatase